MNSLQLPCLKTGIDDLAVHLGDKFKNVFEKMIENAIDPLENILLEKEEINKRLQQKRKIPEFDSSKLTKECQEFLSSTSPTTCCSDQVLITSYLAVAGACLRKKVKIEGPTGKFYPNVWNIQLGKSGSAKTTGANITLSMLHKLDEPLEKEAIELKNKYEFEMNKYEQEVKKIIKKGGTYNDLQKPEMPRKNTISYPVIASLERYYEIFSQESSSGLINTSEEISTWFQNLKKTDNLKEFLTSCYGGKVPPNMVSYKNSKSFTVNNPLVSLLGPSTPDWVFNNFDTEDYRSGFFQRILWTVNESNKKRMAFPEVLSNDKWLYFKDKLGALYDFSINDESQIEISLSDQVKNYFENKVFKDLEERKKNIESDIVISCLDRYWNEYLFKYALILHCLNSNWLNQDPIISLETFKAAEYLISYFESTLLYVLDEIENSKSLNMAQKIVGKLRKAPNYEIKKKTFADQNKGYSQNKDVFLEALDILKDLEIVKITARKNNSNNGTKSEFIHLLEK